MKLPRLSLRYRPLSKAPDCMTDIADRRVFTDEENALLISIETRLAQEMVRLVGPLREFARRSQLISKELPDNAHFCKLVSSLLPLLALQFSNALLQGVRNRTFVCDGTLHLKDLGLGLNDFVRKIDLDGRQFLAVALIERKASDIDEVVQAGLKYCERCNSLHYAPPKISEEELQMIVRAFEDDAKHEGFSK